MDIENFPFLTHEEFAEACHHFDRRYCQATLGPVRRRWKLRVCTALDVAFSTHGGYTHYIQIIRPLDSIADPSDISLDLGNFSISEKTVESACLMGDDEMVDAEESDSVWNSG